MRGSVKTLLYGVASMDLPAYFVNSGFTSKLSTWLTPPHRKTQMTLFALGAWCVFFETAAASRCSMAARARPGEPMPVCERKERRETPGQVFMERPSRWDVVIVPGARAVSHRILRQPGEAGDACGADSRTAGR